MLRWSLPLGSLLGVRIFVHWTFLLLLAFFMARPLLSGDPDAVAAALRTAGFIVAIFGCVLLHELGHALAARRFGIGTRDITLLPIGGVARLERMPTEPVQELVVALAGPAVNVAIAAILIPLAIAIDGAGLLESLGQGAQAASSSAELAQAGAAAAEEDPARATAAGADVAALHHAHFLAALGLANVFLVVFNLIPALPMDGGRVLRALLSMGMDRGRATAIAAMIGQGFAVLFAIVGVMSGNFLLVLIAFFVFLAAGAEASSEQFRSSLEGLDVRSAILTRFRVLRAGQPLRDAAAELLAGSQQDFPVIADGASEDLRIGDVVGILTRAALVRAVAEGRIDAPIAEAMTPGCPVAWVGDDLQHALERARAAAEGGIPAVIVVSDLRSEASDPRRPGRIVGIVTPENVSELVLLRSAARSGAGARQR
ncbi:MAG TPA: site-2 protease family protein [Phycisphaerales bacterium]|nr:site-2 protease family protein [Phycisphaerales bacterium]HMP37111.1 site-2 protease family protein [Phycisphaerales bacterium]